jgi:signal transduction histidine kinase
MTRWWRALLGDTLFKRLFLLMWVALVASNLLAFGVMRQFTEAPGGGPPGGMRLPPVLPSLPPMGAPPARLAPDGPPPAPQPGDRPQPEAPPSSAPFGPDEPRGGGLPARALWIDYLVRVVGIGVAAWFGARWLSAPMRRLAEASDGLGGALVDGRALPVLEADRGTLEVRQTAQVFNTMAQRLRAQFDAQTLLMAAISHDLRTPLARLRLRLETMDEQTQTSRCIDDVREMDALIGSVLEMLRDSHLRGEPGRIDVGALVQAMVDDLVEQGEQVRLVGGANSEAGTASTGGAIVLAQPAALKRVLGNLIGNALRHGGGTAEVSVATTPGREVIVVVADRGPGIAREQLDAVFQPFYRVDPARGRGAGGGSGLGLYIARDLAQRSGGRLQLNHRDGGGLQATLSLPLA